MISDKYQAIIINMASRITNYAEIQQDELEALRSIYMEDFNEEAVRTGAWNVGVNMFSRTSSALIP